MKSKRWFQVYLLAMGTAIMTIGVILSLRSSLERKSFPGLCLGVTLVIYGFLRLWQRKNLLVKNK